MPLLLLPLPLLLLFSLPRAIFIWQASSLQCFDEGTQMSNPLAVA